jgi:hypothetical protein
MADSRTARAFSRVLDLPVPVDDPVYGSHNRLIGTEGSDGGVFRMA